MTKDGAGDEVRERSSRTAVCLDDICMHVIGREQTGYRTNEMATTDKESRRIRIRWSHALGHSDSSGGASAQIGKQGRQAHHAAFNAARVVKRCKSRLLQRLPLLF